MSKVFDNKKFFLDELEKTNILSGKLETSLEIIFANVIF